MGLLYMLSVYVKRIMWTVNVYVYMYVPVYIQQLYVHANVYVHVAVYMHVSHVLQQRVKYMYMYNIKPKSGILAPWKFTHSTRLLVYITGNKKIITCTCTCTSGSTSVSALNLYSGSGGHTAALDTLVLVGRAVAYPVFSAWCNELRSLYQISGHTVAYMYMYM